ncbi:MAG: hypothetical protein AB7P04_01345 [Bacteriovoracia bacterium]
MRTGLAFAILSTSVFTTAPTLARAADQVVVGAYINDIPNVDVKTHTFALDLYVWFRWKKKHLNPAKSIEFLNPYELWAMTRTQDYEEPILLPTGEYYQVVRFQGRFSQKMHLRNYPFDRQTLSVAFEDTAGESAQLAYRADEKPISMNPQVELPGYKLGEPKLTVSTASYPTDFGDPRSRSDNAFSRLKIEIPIHHPTFTYLIKLLLPVLCVIFCAALMFLLNPTYVDSRVGIGITSLLTVVALQITLNEDLPEIDYLVLMDKIYLGAYIFIIASLAIVVKTTWTLEKGKVQRAIQLDRLGLITLTSGFFVFLAVILISAAV